MPRSTSETSLIWEHRERISVLETQFKGLNDGLKSIDSKVDSLLIDSIPDIRNQINRNKWEVGLVVGILSVIGSAAASLFLQGLFT